MSSGVAIVGAAESDLGITGLSALHLLTQATSRALADAGLGLADVDGLATNGIGRFSAASVAEYLGLRPRWTDTTFAGGASYEVFVGSAARAILAGDADTVVIAYGSNQRSAASRSLRAPADAALPEAQFESPYDPLYPISLYALAAQRYLHDHPGSRRALDEVAVAAREWALRNPRAYRRSAGPLQPGDVTASPAVSTPLHQLDCCLVTDGGGCVVLTSSERAQDLRTDPVEVLGWGQHTTGSSMAEVMRRPAADGAQRSATAALTMAGITASDVDVVEVYDSFTINVLLSLEGLGLCGPGEATDFVADGRIRPGGALPLNTSGGGLSYCHPGMLGVLLLVEAVHQLRHEAGERQVPGAARALVHATGGILSTHATVVLGTDR